MILHRSVGWIALMAMACCSLLQGRTDNRTSLRDEDKKYLGRLVKELLFDPRGAEYVAVSLKVRSPYGVEKDEEVRGWYVAPKGNNPGRVHFEDGWSISAPAADRRKPVDFVKSCQERYLNKNQGETGAPVEMSARAERVDNAVMQPNDLVFAAWLHALGNDELAATALATARETGNVDPEKKLQDELAWVAYGGMIHAYIVRADEEALEHGKRFLKRYATVDGHGFTVRQAHKIVEELRRRQKKGTFAKAPPKSPPAEYEHWTPDKKVAFWIDRLEEVDARQTDQFGVVDTYGDPRVQALIQLGDVAVPALIDTCESDERLTRSVCFRGDSSQVFFHHRNVLGVREAALTALMSLLRVSVFQPVPPKDIVGAEGQNPIVAAANPLRAYWQEYGKYPFDERMMKTLIQPGATFEAKRQAACNLAGIDDPLSHRRMYGYVHYVGNRGGRPNPVIAKFNHPTVAEAILAAMDTDLQKLAKTQTPEEGRDPEDLRSERRLIWCSYLAALIQLGDKGIGLELVRRAEGNKPPAELRTWAYVAHFLGQPGPFAKLAEALRLGNMKFSSNQDGERELGAMIESLIGVHTALAEQALAALADPKHAQHETVVKGLIAASTGEFGTRSWYLHPFCVAVLRSALDDTTLTDRKYLIEQDDTRQWIYRNGLGGSSRIPRFLTDPKLRKNGAYGRRCDLAAEKLYEVVIGVPRCHPLRFDNEERLAELKKAIDRCAGRYRIATQTERDLIWSNHWSPTYIPDISPLNHPATAADVEAGRAIFHLDGKGKLTDLKLPASGTVKGDTPASKTEPALIVQAEEGPQGVVYGVITRTALRTLPANEVTSIKPLANEVEGKKTRR